MLYNQSRRQTIHTLCMQHNLFQGVPAPKYIAFLGKINDYTSIKEIKELLCEYADAHTIEYFAKNFGIL